MAVFYVLRKYGRHVSSFQFRCRKLMHQISYLADITVANKRRGVIAIVSIVYDVGIYGIE